jgi:hypothetical protein
MPNDVAVPDQPGTEVANADDQALAQAALAGLSEERAALPQLKLLQQLSKEVTEDGQESGTFVNSLTKQNYGPSVGLIVVYTAKGRLYSNDDEGTFAAIGDVAPPYWPDRFVGKRFDELPEAEETFRERVNDPESDLEWGKGPAIQTTRNFIGFLPEDPDIPVRLSLKGTSTPAARKINDLLRYAFTAPWSNVIDLRAQSATNKREQAYFKVEAGKGRATTPEEVAIAQQFSRQAAASLDRYVLSESDEDAEARRAKREAAAKSDGLDVA